MRAAVAVMVLPGVLMMSRSVMAERNPLDVALVPAPSEVAAARSSATIDENTNIITFTDSPEASAIAKQFTETLRRATGWKLNGQTQSAIVFSIHEDPRLQSEE